MLEIVRQQQIVDAGAGHDGSRIRQQARVQFVGLEEVAHDALVDLEIFAEQRRLLLRGIVE